MKQVSLLIAVVLMAMGCGGEDGSVEVLESSGPDTLFISPVDTIGILMGDSNYVFGTIGDVLYTADGNIAVLDEVGCCARIFDPAGTFLMQVSREGSGPGEVLRPGGMVLLSNGYLAILDQITGGIHLFQPDGTFDTLMVDFQGQAVPQWAWGVDNLALVGATMQVDMQDDGLIGSFVIGRWEDSTEPVVIYHENTFPFNPQDMASFMENTFFSTTFAADRDGAVYMALISSSDYAIDIFNGDGTILNTISREIPRVEKTPEEIQEETALISAIMRERGVPEHMIDYSADPFRWMIPPQGLGADGSGRIWAQNGTVDETVLDVYSRNGEHLAVVVCQGISGPDHLNFMNIKVQPQGLLAFSMQDPDFPRVFVLPMPELPGGVD